MLIALGAEAAPRLCAAIVDRLTFNGTIIEPGPAPPPRHHLSSRRTGAYGMSRQSVPVSMRTRSTQGERSKIETRPVDVDQVRVLGRERLLEGLPALDPDEVGFD